jgi:hypothetical protein
VRVVCPPAARSWALRGVEADSLPPGRRRLPRCAPSCALELRDTQKNPEVTFTQAD